jgi:Zn-dependent protease
MILRIITIAPGFLLAITVHEFAHGYVALRYGDPTAQQAGRLTFNPISHLDLFGTLFFLLTAVAGFAIGWAKPVPVNPRYLRNPRGDMVWISFAGPAANMVAAAALAVIFHLITHQFSGQVLSRGTMFVLSPLINLLYFAVVINVVLAVFNLIPLPPLDGSKIVAGLLPTDLALHYETIERFGFIILVALFATNILDYIIRPPISFLLGLLGMPGA